ncbi:hypothetical protein ACFLU8_02295 [Chloroflexota bacterium]
MPGKSQHGKHKLSRSKRGKGRKEVPAIPTQQPVVIQTSEPVSPSEVSAAPSKSVPVAVATPVADRYPYIATELRRIAILAGVMLVILVILALVFS